MDKSTPEVTCSVCLGLTASPDSLGDCGDSWTIAIFKASSEQGCWGCKVMVDLFHTQNLGHGVQYSIQLFRPDYVFHHHTHVAIWNSETSPKTLSTATRVFEILSFPGICLC
ncbi:hypothetical protein HBI72_032710 [Parastagonospora nodorum]|nr:hypothetical protein HBH42_085130 [Parastagonospora nodorum]KAH4990250.1 hypothetical protein HBI76_065100 [Parastagonospora nodorum]KAH5277699.1 hypothetical protein HBI72_032710 [Parastagonospora nodorum]KAH6048340.1 hypothetical protein HBI54_065030 [Parastagonospora nodorum]